MEENKTGTKCDEVKPRKLGYEELENAAHQLSEQSRQLYMQNQQLKEAIQESNLLNLYKRLDYLWLVINSNNPLLSENFMKECASEFMELMLRPKPEEAEDREE